MTAEDRCKVFKDLLLWAWRHEGEVLYMEERVYAVSNGKSVMLVIAGNPKEAKDKVRELGYEQGKCNCSHCDYFKFSQSFIDNIVKFMTDYNIESVEDLMKELNHINELLGGKQ